MQPVTVRRWEIVLAFVLLAASFVVAVALVNHEAKRRSASNRELIQRLEAVRVENRSRFRQTDVINCVEIEKLKAGFRQQAIENFAQLDQNGKLLGITITPQLRAAALAGLKKTLRRYSSRPGGCGTLPSVKPTNGGS